MTHKVTLNISVISLLTLVTILVFVANLFFGSVQLPAKEILDILCGNDGNAMVRFIVLESRLPAAVTALLCGGALATSGLLLQTVFHNPLAGPSILGISSGAGLGVAVIMLLLGGSFSVGETTLAGCAAVIIGALIGALLMTGILLFLSSIVRNNLLLLITGILAGYVTTSVVTLLSSWATSKGIQGYVTWGMGTFTDVSSGQLSLFSILIISGLIGGVLLVKPLNILQLGENYARNLGLDVNSSRNLILLVSGVLTAVSTAYCGPIGFIGMAMPQLARLMLKTDDCRLLLPMSALSGGCVCLLCNVASTMFGASVIPINTLTPIVGIPIILYVLLHKR